MTHNQTQTVEYDPSSLDDEDLINLEDARDFYEQRTSHRPSFVTVYRHACEGVKLKTGGRAFLEHVRVGGRIYTSREAISRFWARASNKPNQRARTRGRNARTRV